LGKVDVRDYLRRSPAVRPAVREKALALLERNAEETDPERYHRAAWAVLREPYLNACQYDFALRQARTACALAPGQARYRTALGARRGPPRVRPRPGAGPLRDGPGRGPVPRRGRQGGGGQPRPPAEGLGQPPPAGRPRGPRLLARGGGAVGAGTTLKSGLPWL